jgi:hypothetical protein
LVISTVPRWALSISCNAISADVQFLHLTLLVKYICNIILTLVIFRQTNDRMGGSSSRTLQPVLQKSSEGGENDRIDYAAASMQGWRQYMEDAVSNPSR